jgi:PAS domain S-box-containing protein
VGLVLVTLLAVLPALGLQLYDGVRQRRHLIADAIVESRRAASTMAQAQVRLTDSTRLLLTTLAAMPEVKRLDVAACNALFASLLASNPGYVNILTVDRKGDIVASGLPHGQVNLADRKHVMEALASGEFSAGEYIISRTAYDPAFPFSLPIRDDRGNVIGVLIAALKLSTFDTFFDQLALPSGSILGIADQRGLRLYFRPKTATNPPGEPVKADVWQQIDAGGEKGTFLLTGSDGRKRYYAYKKLSLEPDQPPYMVFVVGLPEEVVLTPVRTALRANLLLLAADAVLALLVAWFLGGAVIGKRLDRIAATAGRIGQGDLSARTGVPYGESGIGKVAKTLDTMAALLSANDATREQALAALRQSQERLAHIAASMADWIWETDAQDRYVYVSPKIRQALGYEPVALLGQTPFVFLAPKDGENTRATFAKAKKDRAPIRDLLSWRLSSDGDTRCILTNAVPWHDETGRFQGYRGVDKDVTERMRTEQELRDSLAEKDILLKEIHHRVKNNLQIISGLLYLQEERVQDPIALESFRESRNRIASMALVHEALYRSANLSRIRLDDYIRDLQSRLFGPAPREPGLRCEYGLEAVEVPIEKAIPAGLAINELLTNAYKHAFKGRPEGTLRLTLKREGPEVLVVVADDGPGLPPDFRLEEGETLGMRLVLNLARQLGGEVTVANDDTGAVFTLRFPG